MVRTGELTPRANEHRLHHLHTDRLARSAGLHNLDGVHSSSASYQDRACAPLLSVHAAESNSVTGRSVADQFSPTRLMLRPGVVQAEVFGINVALLLVLSTQLDAGALLSLMALVNGLFIAAIIGVFCGSLSRRGRSALPVCVAALAACLVSASFDAGLLRLGTWRIAEAVRLLSDGVDLRYIVDAGVRSVGATEIGTALALPMLSLAVAASSITRAYLADRPAPVLLGSPETPQALLATDLTPSGSLMRE